jgi:hypothetical protein
MIIKSERVVRPAVVNMTPLELDRIAEKYISSFPGMSCFSVNNEVVQTMPGLKKLKNGDNGSIHLSGHSHAIQEYTEGHGYGRNIYEVPQILTVSIPDSMINLGRYEVNTEDLTLLLEG